MKGKVLIMRIFEIYSSFGVCLARVAKPNADAAYEWFKATYPHKGVGYIVEV